MTKDIRFINFVAAAREDGHDGEECSRCWTISVNGEPKVLGDAYVNGWICFNSDDPYFHVGEAVQSILDRAEGVVRVWI